VVTTRSAAGCARPELPSMGSELLDDTVLINRAADIESRFNPSRRRSSTRMLSPPRSNKPGVKNDQEMMA
jgi:hypothetical protein